MVANIRYDQHRNHWTFINAVPNTVVFPDIHLESSPIARIGTETLQAEKVESIYVEKIWDATTHLTTPLELRRHWRMPFSDQ